ncbi:Mast cell carboxypeptidase A, partial [Fragariocoptes setiger]
KKYPNRVNVFTIGTTAEQRPLKALEIVNNATDPDYVWVDALTHAREWITGSTILYIIDKVARRDLNKNFIFVPVVNPDGYSFTWTSDRMWRKNRSKHPLMGDTGRSQQDKCIGTDLNRNFDLNFGGEETSPSVENHMRVLRAIQKAVYETDGVKYDIGPLRWSIMRSTRRGRIRIGECTIKDHPTTEHTLEGQRSRHGYLM